MTLPATAAPIAIRIHRSYREAVAELLAYRELLASLVRRELVIRYRYAPLGVAWALLLPLVTTIIFSIVFTRVAPLDVGAPYPVFAYTGLWVWHLSASAIRASTTALSGHGSLITKIYFPREVLPFTSLLVALVDFAVGGALLAVMLAAFGIAVSWTLLLLPLLIVVQLALTASLVLLASMGSLLLRDLRHLIEIALTLSMYATAVLYPLDRIGGAVGAVLELNPMSTIIEAYRDVLLRGAVPPAGPLAAVAVLSGLGLAASWMLFRRGAADFAERV